MDFEQLKMSIELEYFMNARLIKSCKMKLNDDYRLKYT